MSYEESIAKRREENREILKSLGIFNAQQEHVKSSAATSARKVSREASRNYTDFDLTPTRRSDRLRGKEAQKYTDIEDEYDGEEFRAKRSRPNQLMILKPSRERIRRENVFGAIPGVPVGTEFATRLDASHAGIHRPTVAGIHGNPSLGCYSLALSGGYEDDIDYGVSFIYTGEGGRDLKGTKAKPKNLRTAPQSKDQVLERGNLALSKNIENNVPVRVLRGYNLRSKFAPTEGYRYDGLYKVVEYYVTKGLSGFSVYKFRMERIEDQDPAPWADDFLFKKNEPLDNGAPSSPEKENIENQDGNQL